MADVTPATTTAAEAAADPSAKSSAAETLAAAKAVTDAKTGPQPGPEITPEAGSQSTADVAAASATSPPTAAPAAAPAATWAEPTKRAIPGAEHLALPFAAAILLAAGLGWAGGANFPFAKANAGTEMQALGSSVAQLSADIASLRQQTAAIAAQQARVSVPTLGPVLSRLDVLADTIDRVQKDQTRLAAASGAANGSDKAIVEKLGAVQARLERIEKSVATGSLPAAVAPAVANQPLPQKLQESAQPKRLDGFILREVDDGIAVIEDRRGVIHELMRGETLPGAGRIQKIERKAGAWLVVTDKGVIGSR